MHHFLEPLGEFFSPYLPFVDGHNAAAIYTLGLLMTGTGLLFLVTVCILRLRRRKG